MLNNVDDRVPKTVTQPFFAPKLFVMHISEIPSDQYEFAYNYHKIVDIYTNPDWLISRPTNLFLFGLREFGY